MLVQMRQKTFVLVLVVMFILLLFPGLYVFSPLCSSGGLQPVKMHCKCLGIEYKHGFIQNYLRQVRGDPELLNEGYDTQCLGIILNRYCEELVQVDCDNWDFKPGVGPVTRQ